MAKAKKSTTGRKAPSAKAALKQKRSVKKVLATKRGIGDNNPPPDHVPPPPPPPISTWAPPMDNSAQIAHATAARQRGLRAATGIGTPTTATPFAAAHDPTHLHQVMLQRIAALEETAAKLVALPEAERIKPKPLDDDELEEIRNVLAKMKVLPPALTRPTAIAFGVPNKLRKFGERVASSMAEDAAKYGVYVAAGALWAEYGQQLIALAHAIAEWLASLPPPPL